MASFNLPQIRYKLVLLLKLKRPQQKTRFVKTGKYRHQFCLQKQCQHFSFLKDFQTIITNNCTGARKGNRLANNFVVAGLVVVEDIVTVLAFNFKIITQAGISKCMLQGWRLLLLLLANKKF